MDTNVILARFAPKDPLRQAAKNFFDSKGDRIVSPISILEICAVLSREGVKFDSPRLVMGETETRRVLAISEYFVEFLGMRVESLSLTNRVRIAGSTLSLPLEYSEALKKAGELKLRTVDLLHLAYSGLISSLRTRIDRFVTSDSGIIDRARTIEAQFGFTVVHPKEAA